MSGRSTLAAGLAAMLGIASVGIGCGYRPLLRDASAPGGVARIAVPLLENDTEQVGLETPLTAALVDRLDRYRALQVTDVEPEAILRGTIRAASLRPTQAVAADGMRHQAFRVGLVMDLRLERADGGGVLWQAMGLRREAEYDMGAVLAGEDILAAEDLRTRALIAAGERAVEEGVELMMGGS